MKSSKTPLLDYIKVLVFSSRVNRNKKQIEMLAVYGISSLNRFMFVTSFLHCCFEYDVVGELL